MPIDRSKMVVTKLDAAKRQLRTAIRLWFAEADPIAIHTLAFAAYEIIHVLSKKHDPYRRTLIFDSDLIKDERRADWNKVIKKAASFFKHANKDPDPDASVEFYPVGNILFIMAALAGLRTMNIRAGKEGVCFFYWLAFHEPGWLKPDFRKTLHDRILIKDVAMIRKIKKADFLKIFETLLK